MLLLKLVLQLNRAYMNLKKFYLLDLVLQINRSFSLANPKLSSSAQSIYFPSLKMVFSMKYYLPSWEIWARKILL